MVLVVISVDGANHCDWIHVGMAEVQQTTDVLIAHHGSLQQEIGRVCAKSL
jgi:hypothetical protein